MQTYTIWYLSSRGDRGRHWRPLSLCRGDRGRHWRPLSLCRGDRGRHWRPLSLCRGDRCPPDYTVHQTRQYAGLQTTRSAGLFVWSGGLDGPPDYAVRRTGTGRSAGLFRPPVGLVRQTRQSAGPFSPADRVVSGHHSTRPPPSA